MAVNVYRGEVAFGTGDTSINDDISSTVDTSKSFIIVYGRGPSTDIERCEFTGVFADSDTVTIQRGESGTATTATYQVIEATNGEFEVIDSGVESVGSGTPTSNVTVSNVGDTSQCTVFYSVRHGSSDNRTQMLYTAQLTTTTNLQLVRQSSGVASELAWWIVKWHSSVNVYNGTYSLTTGSGSETIEGSPTVTLAQTALFMNWNADTNGLAQTAVQGYLDTTTIYFARDTSTGSCDITYSVVEFPSDVVIQSDNGSSSPTLDTSTDVTISSVTLANTMNVHTNTCTGTGTAFPRTHVTSHLSGTTTLELREDYSGQTKTVTYYVIDFSAWSLADTYTHDQSVKANLDYAPYIYSRGDEDSLPSGTDDLETSYSVAEVADVADDDGTRVSFTGAVYIIHQYKYHHENSTDGITVNWNGQTDTAPSLSTVYLQIYNHNSTTWENLDSDNTSSASTDFTLSGSKTSSISDYYDANNYVYVRVYQENSN